MREPSGANGREVSRSRVLCPRYSSDGYFGRARDEGLVLPGKAERALRYEFICKMGGPPEFRYCNGEWAKHVELSLIHI